MQLIGQTVTHEIFGKGVVTDRKEQTLTVRFPEGSRNFLYPEAFSKYLVAQNADLQNQIVALLETQEAERMEQEREEMAHWEREITLRSRKIPTRSQSVFDIRPQDAEQVFSEWSVSTGTYLSGFSRGDPRIPDRMGPNSLCLVTARPEGAPEKERRILGLFMPPEDFSGAECEDGIVHAHPRYRIAFPQSEQPLFWPFLATEPAKQKWGSTAFKYLPNETGERILRALRNQHKSSRALQDFYEYFCFVNHLDPVPCTA